MAWRVGVDSGRTFNDVCFWTVTVPLTLPAVVGAWLLAFVVLLMGATFSALPSDLKDACAMLGAPPLRAFLLVTLLLAAPGAVAAAALSFLLSFDKTVISLFLVGPCLTTLPVALFHCAESPVDPLLAALAVTLVGITLVAVLAVDRLAGFTRTIGTT